MEQRRGFGAEPHWALDDLVQNLTCVSGLISSNRLLRNSGLKWTPKNSSRAEGGYFGEYRGELKLVVPRGDPLQLSVPASSSTSRSAKKGSVGSCLTCTGCPGFRSYFQVSTVTWLFCSSHDLTRAKRVAK